MGEVQTREQEIEALQKRLAELRAESARAPMRVYEFPVEVTVAIPAYNCWRTLGDVLFALEQGAQSIPMKLLICDNGSTDVTGDIVASPRFAKWLKEVCHFPDVTVLEPTPHTDKEYLTERVLNNQEAKLLNVQFQRAKLAVFCDTPYIWYVDADVLAPVGAGRTLLDALKADEKLAALGILYDWKVDHVQWGCTMCRTPVMKALKWRAEGCECRYATRLLREAGYKVEYLPPEQWTARHRKHESAGPS